MADLPVQPVLNYGQMLGSYGESLAAQQNASTAALSAHAQLPQIAANTAMTQTQTAGADLANQKTAMQLGLLQRLTQPPVVNDQSAPHSADTSSADTSGDTALGLSDGGISADHITSAIQSKYAVRDQWTPQELQQLQNAPLYAAAGIPGMDQVAMQQHKARIDTATSQAQLGASNTYDQSYAISSAPDGHRLAVLETIHPDAAAAIEKIADTKGWTPEQTDQYVKTYADEVGNAVHKYSGRPVEVGKDGIARDTQTQQPVLGGAPQGVTPGEHADIVQKSNALVDTFTNGVTTKVPQWRASGYSSATAYQNAALANGGTAPPPPQLGGTAPAAPKVPGAPAPTVGGNAAPAPSAAAPAPPAAAPPPPAAPKAPATAATGAPPAAGAPPRPAAAAPVDPVLSKALADPEYKYTPPKIPDGQAIDPDSQKLIDAHQAARTQLVNDASSATKAAQQAQVYLDAAKTITDSGGAPTGAGAAGRAKVDAVLGQLGWGNREVDATNYQEAVKFLGNAAIQAQKSNFPNATQSEVGLTLNELNPSLKMTPQAVGNLIGENQRNAQYAIDSAHRVGQYLTAGGDPQKFNDWNGHYYNQSKAVNPQPAAASTGPKVMPPAAKLQAYATAHFNGDTAKASAYLNEKGYK
jgi:hypothetical protein